MIYSILLKELLKLFRPKDSLIHLACVFIPLFFITPSFPIFFIVSFISVLGFFFSFGINQFADTDVDSLKLDKKKNNPFISSRISKNLLLTPIIIVAILPIILSLQIFGTFVSIFFIFCLMFSFVYSFPPFRFKTKFLFDILVHGASLVSITLFSFFAFSTDLRYLISSLILSFLVSTLFELTNEILDFKSDKKAGFKTTVIKLGVKKSLGLFFLTLFAFYFSIIISMLQIFDGAVIIFALIFGLHLISVFTRLYKTNGISFTINDVYFPMFIFFTWLFVKSFLLNF